MSRLTYPWRWLRSAWIGFRLGLALGRAGFVPEKSEHCVKCGRSWLWIRGDECFCSCGWGVLSENTKAEVGRFP